MFALLAILNLLNDEQRSLLELYFNSAHDEIKLGATNAFDEIDMLPDFLFNHFGLEIELYDSQITSLMSLLERKAYVSAFRVMRAG